MSIHPTAVVSPGAVIAEDATVGPFSVIGEHVVLGPKVEVMSHVVIDGRTTIGEGTRIFPFASVGLPPQDLKYKGEPSQLRIGRDCMIREHVTVNTGTEGGGMLTTIGDRVLLAIGAHIAHDCTIGDNVLVMNHVLLGGHVTLGDFAVLGGGSAVHQFARVGKHAMIGGLTGVENDVIPFGTVTGNRARLEGLNIVGLRRRGFAREDIHAIRAAYRVLFDGESESVFADRVNEVAATWPDSITVQEVVGFLHAESSRAITRPATGTTLEAALGHDG